MPLAEAEALRHVEAAMPRPGARARDLLSASVPLERPPDPSALFQLRLHRHRALPALRDPSPLSVLSYNVGLLSRAIPIERFEGPEVAARREVLPEILLADGWDVLLLQEVWDESDVERFARAARAHGYAWYAGPRHHAAHGLLVLVRRSIIDPRDEPWFQEHRFARQRRFERVPGVGIQRGMIAMRFRHRTSGAAIVLVNTHTTAFPAFQAVRASQVRELGRRISTYDPDAIVILGGDVNAGPFYADDVYGQARGRPVSGWWRNALAYPLLLHHGGLEDTRIVAAPARDVELARRLPAWDERFCRAPYGGGDLRPDPDRDTFTVGDHNGLYFRQYGGREYPARIDHVMFRDRHARVRVDTHELRYVEPHDFGATGRFELSDHYGVGVRLRLECAPWAE